MKIYEMKQHEIIKFFAEKEEVLEEDLLLFPDIPTAVAAKYLGKTNGFIIAGLQTQSLPIGAAVKHKKQYSYSIPPERLIAYKKGTLPYKITVYESAS